MITRPKRRDIRSCQRGLSVVTMAIVLPVVLLALLGSMDLFLFFRSAAVVQRAASEAAQVMASSDPGSGTYNNHELSAVNNKVIYTHYSGGSPQGDLTTNFPLYGHFYQRNGGPVVAGASKITELPFLLSTTENGPVHPDSFPLLAANGDPGVQYLPFVNIFTCLEPRNEGVQQQTLCGDGVSSKNREEFLTYKLAPKIDFDGDGAEDIAFYYPNSADDDWWVLPSGSGTYFRNALRFELGVPYLNTNPATNRDSYHPCPADYDGDGITDFCIAGVKSQTVDLRIRFSTQKYIEHNNYTLANVRGLEIAPVPGRWSSGASADQFAVVILEGTPTTQLATYVWPEITVDAGESPLSASRFALTDTPTKYEDSDYKPDPGRNWRIAFDDIDGDGVMNIGWATWDGGNLTSHIAGAGQGLETSTGIDAKDADLTPWKLFFPSDPDGPGLYVVERSNHRVVLIDKENDGSLKGETTSQIDFQRIAGGNPAGIPAFAINEPNPVAIGRRDTDAVPVVTGTDGCSTCYAGGNWDSTDDGSTARDAVLNSPRDVFTTGDSGDPLFIADFGNYRVRAVSTGSDNYVNGDVNETISTIAGGTATVDCATLYTAAAPLPGGCVIPGIGGASADLSCYDTTAHPNGFHPTCISIRPVALTYQEDAGQPYLFIADDRGAVFRLDPNDSTFDAATDANELLNTAIGLHNGYPLIFAQVGFHPTSGPIGTPTAMATDTDNNILVTITRDYNWGDSHPDTSIGGIYVIAPGADGIVGSADDTIAAFYGSLSGNLAKNAGPDIGPALHGYQTATDIDFRNPTSIAVHKNKWFVTGWWQSTGGSPHRYGNSLIMFYSSIDDDTLPDSYVRLDNYHNAGWNQYEPGNNPVVADPELYTRTWDDAMPLSTIMTAPGVGVAVEPGGEYVYFSQTKLGSVLGIHLDKDGDGTPDVNDANRDGDALTNANESAATRDLYHDDDSGSRTIHLYQDAMVWAMAPGGGADITLNGTDVHRMEYFIDQFAAVAGFPPGVIDFWPDRQHPYEILSDTGIVVMAPRAAIHTPEVYVGGPVLGNETHGTTSNYQLSPIFMADRSPNEAEIKDQSGYLRCPDWDMDESTLTKIHGAMTGASSIGVIQQTCGRNIGVAMYTDGRKVGTRRIQPAHWENRWMTYTDATTAASEMIFVDWDGDGVTNATLYDTEEVDGADAYPYPLVAFVGNISTCPGDFSHYEFHGAGSNLGKALQNVLNPWYGSGFNSTVNGQYRCATNQQFLTRTNGTVAQIVLDARAEWEATWAQSTTNYGAVTGNRLSLGAVGDGDPTGTIGAVAETAYQILEQSLRVDARENNTDDYGAQVSIIDPDPLSSDVTARIEVTYIFPLSPFVNNLLGRPNIEVKSAVTRRVHNFFRTSSY